MMTNSDDNNSIKSFLIDSKAFYEAVRMLELYRDSLQLAYDNLIDVVEIEGLEDEVPEEAFEDMKEQIEVVNNLILNFRTAVIQSIHGSNSNTPEYH